MYIYKRRSNDTKRFLSIEDGNKIPHADRLEFLFRALQPVCD